VLLFAALFAANKGSYRWSSKLLARTACSSITVTTDQI
jgi:hypothetical protein